MTEIQTRCYRLTALGAVTDESGRMVPRLMIATDQRIVSQLGIATVRLQADMESHGGRPSAVPEAIWERAKEFDANAMAEANALAPGCVYIDRSMLDWIVFQSGIASFDGIQAGRQGSEPDRAKEAKWLLTKICVPRVYSKKERSLGKSNLGEFPLVYMDVLVLRAVFRHMRGKAAKSIKAKYRRSDVNVRAYAMALAGIKRIFPDLDHLQPRWIDMICRVPYGASVKDADIFKPVNVAARILGDVLGYKHVKIREAVKKTFEYRVDLIRKEAQTIARRINSELGTGRAGYWNGAKGGSVEPRSGPS